MATFNINTVLLSLNFFAIITPYVETVEVDRAMSTDRGSIYSFSLFLPSIISGLGYNSVKAQLFTVPPYMAGFFAVILCTYLSDKLKARGPIMIGCCSLAIVGYIMLIVKTRPLIHYGGYAGLFCWWRLFANSACRTFLVAAGTYLRIFSNSTAIVHIPGPRSTSQHFVGTVHRSLVHFRFLLLPKLTMTAGVFPSSPTAMGWYRPHYPNRKDSATNKSSQAR